MWKKVRKLMGILRQPSQLQKTIDKKQLKSMKYFKYMGSILTNYASCTHKIKIRFLR
jgi:hypothetical protein